MIKAFSRKAYETQRGDDPVDTGLLGGDQLAIDLSGRLKHALLASFANSASLSRRARRVSGSSAMRRITARTACHYDRSSSAEAGFMGNAVPAGVSRRDVARRPRHHPCSPSSLPSSRLSPSKLTVLGRVSIVAFSWRAISSISARKLRSRCAARFRAVGGGGVERGRRRPKVRAGCPSLTGNAETVSRRRMAKTTVCGSTDRQLV